MHPYGKRVSPLARRPFLIAHNLISPGGGKPSRARPVVECQNVCVAKVLHDIADHHVPYRASGAEHRSQKPGSPGCGSLSRERKSPGLFLLDSSFFDVGGLAPAILRIRIESRNLCPYSGNLAMRVYTDPFGLESVFPCFSRTGQSCRAPGISLAREPARRARPLPSPASLQADASTPPVNIGSTWPPGRRCAEGEREDTGTPTSCYNPQLETTFSIFIS